MERSIFQHSLSLQALVVCVCLVAFHDSNVYGETSIYEGFTEPRFEIMVAASEIGRLHEVSVKVGDRVQEGDAVAKLEDRLQQSALRVAKMQASMHGEIDAALAEKRLQENRVKQLRDLATDAMARPNELKRAEADLEVAQARHTAAEEQRELRELEVNRYQIQLDRRQVIAPRSGVVAEVYHQAGEYITPSDPAVIRLLVVNELMAVFNVPADEIDRFDVDQKVDVFLRSSRVTVSGVVHGIAPAIDGESGTVEMRVLLDNRQGKLRVGDRCTVSLESQRRAASTHVPLQNKRTQ